MLVWSESEVMSSEITAVSEAAIVLRLLDPSQGPSSEDLSPEVARYLLHIDFRETDRQRMRDLVEKHRLGTLTKEEDSELNSYIHVGNLLAILKSKARRSLREPPPHS